MTGRQSYEPAPPEPPKSSLGRLNPMTQLGLAGVLALAALIFPWYVGVATMIICFVLAGLLGKFRSFFKIWWKIIFVLVLIILVLRPFSSAGRPSFTKLVRSRRHRKGWTEECRSPAVCWAWARPSCC